MIDAEQLLMWEAELEPAPQEVLFQTVVIAPHYDDVDLGASILAANAGLLVVAGQDNERRVEQHASSHVLKMAGMVRGDWPDGAVTHDVALVRFIERGIAGAAKVLIPPVLDTHQDHVATARACISATRRSPVTVIEYETPSVMADWVPNMWMPMSEPDLDRQVEAVACHRTQVDKDYMTRRWLEARAIFRGQQVGLPLAQAYRTVRSVG